jgi:hypothetical protein
MHILLVSLGSLNAVLFIIGVRELGHGRKRYSKEEKQDLMHIAICKVLSYEGHYEYEKTDEDGWPHYKQLKAIPKKDVLDQVVLLKTSIIHYFEKDGILANE